MKSILEYILNIMSTKSPILYTSSFVFQRFSRTIGTQNKVEISIVQLWAAFFCEHNIQFMKDKYRKYDFLLTDIL